jgi:predicted NAD/FAD-binding protein
LVRFKAGTRSLVMGLAKNLSFMSGSPVAEISRAGKKLLVRNGQGDCRSFDRVIVATQANQCLFLKEEEFARERRILDEFSFDSGRLLVHSDKRLMPAQRRDWAALNYLMDKDLERSMFTVWVNAVEPSLHGEQPIFQTWNPLIEPAPELTQLSVPMQRAVVTRQSVDALSELERLHREKGRQIFFCGSWASPGVPLLESAVRSALAVARNLSIDIPLSLDSGDSQAIVKPGLFRPQESYT